MTGVGTQRPFLEPNSRVSNVPYEVMADITPPGEGGSDDVRFRLAADLDVYVVDAMY